MPKERKLHQYRVEVLEKHSHGRKGKGMYFALALYGFNLYDAELVGREVVAGMSWEEIEKYCIHETKIVVFSDNRKKPIGFEMADKYFSFHAYTDYWED